MAGKRLLQAATVAKKAVESEVTKALEAVVDMDKSLKEDLKSFKDEIKGGIRDVIDKSGVNDLDTLVKSDLGRLRERIKGLRDKVKNEIGDDSNIVRQQLRDLEGAKSTLHKLASKIGPESIVALTAGLDTKFTDVIQQPLKKLIDDVNTAIGALGEKFDKPDTNTFESIFEHIRDKVGAIKGRPKVGRSNGSGLDGIVSEVKGLARAFVPGSGQNGFKARVGGWLEGVIGNGTKSKPGLQAVNTLLAEYQNAAKGGGHDEQALRDQVKNHIMAALNSQIGAAQGKIGAVKEGIKENLTAIVSACEEFVSKLDEKITKTEIERFAPAIAGQIQGWGTRQLLHTYNNVSDLRSAVKYILVALCAGVNQVATEIRVLGNNTFGTILDKIKPIVDKLHNHLDLATQKSATFQPSPAQAVDGKLEDVKSEVKGLEDTFKQKVKKELQEDVNKLDGAVRDFDT
ncbi:Extracellular matrix-binding ebh, putative [Babesia ovata]|uniref:Extracellular matrix-binding ebh, putative n=1 Tax=Babesia ovata TaxID=189622 RepID=A0A2H6KDV1_9APIC|nr:Extracellular matrix-binding ebh, putative [Babesia ovata]GBE61154.1 Extracellular matrix-binding ebh, putative [Babesia ovata]